MSSPYQKTYFLLSVADIKQLPADNGREVAIVGISNAGKSSVLNCITKNKHIARVSKTPGRTQFINFFAIDDKRRIADLPGYGYAKVPLAVKQKWQKSIDAYLSNRKSLCGMIVVMDIRHPLKPLDSQLLAYCAAVNLPVHILLNKADKMSKGASLDIEKKVKVALTDLHNNVTLQVFSAAKGTGLRELHLLLNKWFAF